MTVAFYHPRLYVGGAFNRDPNDPSMVPTWTDLTSMLTLVTESSRGRQYELGETLAAQPTMTFRDPAELLNPANTTGALYPNVQPYRETVMLAQWPNTPGYSHVNLLNSGMWHGNKIVDTDPSFESYANGAVLPNWTARYGNLLPGSVTVTTANPQQGTKSLTWAVTAITDPQGVSWTVWCLPGVQYTSSLYVRQTTASTQRIEVTGQTVVQDDFSPRTVVAGLGTPNFGPAWAIAGGAGADFAVSGGLAIVTPSVAAVDRYAAVALGSTEQNQVAAIGPIATPAASVVRQGFVGRYVDTANHYTAFAEVSTTGAVSAIIAKRGAGSATLATTVTSLSAAAPLMLRFECTGAGTLRLKVWDASTPEPDAWTTTATDTSHVGTNGGLFVRKDSGTGPSYTYSAYQAVVTVLGTTTTTTGAYVRLTATWTATQPTHTVRLTTVGLAVAGTVNLDSLQHEEGGAATTWETQGPVIYPVMRPYAERWPRRWESQGFEGYTDPPCVDGFAAIAALTLKPELTMATLELRPRFYYPMHDGIDTVGWLDNSGFHQPPLYAVPSRYGAAAPVAPGTEIAIPGLQGGDYGNGVAFTYVGSSGSVKQGGTVLSTGLVPGRPQVAIPSAAAVAANTWAVSVSAWVQLTASSDTWQTIAYALKSNGAAVGSPGVKAIQVSVSTTQMRVNVLAGGFTTSLLPSAVDGQMHHVVAIINVVAGTGTITAYVDGESDAGIPLPGYTLPSPADTLTIGATADPVNFYDVAKGTITEVAVFDYALSQDQVLDIARAGIEPGIQETPNVRTLRHLALAGYTGATRITTLSDSFMQLPSWQNSMNMLTDAQNNTRAEQGCIWYAPDGAFVAESREDRFLRLTPSYTFGENAAGGEMPYLEGVEFDFDPFFVFADVTVDRPGGSLATGGISADIATARRKFFPRPFSAEVDVFDDAQAQDLADWVFNTHKAPMMRVSAITLDPASNPDLWPFCLRAEVGQRVRVIRRAKAANGGTGLTMSADFFIENVKTNEINRTTGRWTFTFLLSPIGSGPGITVQPWILDNTTYSVLGTTTVLGF